MIKLIGPTTAWLRHVGTAAGSIVAVIGILAGMTPDEQAKLLAAVDQIGNGLSAVLAGIGVIVPIVSAVWAHWSAKPAQQVAAVNALPNAQVVPVDPTKPVTATASATVNSHWLAPLIGLVMLAPLVGGCVRDGDAPATAAPSLLSTPAGQAEAIDAAWLLAKSAGAAYVATCTFSPTLAICSDAVLIRTKQVLAVGEQDVAATKVAIAAAGSDQTKLANAVSIGMAAISAAENTIIGLGIGKS